MPETCNRCSLSSVNVWGERTCSITRKNIPFALKSGGNLDCKPKWCPLVEVMDGDLE